MTAETAQEWLAERARGYRDLLDPDHRAILGFTFLWSLFEARIMKNRANVNTIRTKVDEWAKANTLEADLYDAELRYFRDRYFANGALTPHFDFLKLRPQDDPALVQAVIKGATNNPHDRIRALLMIVWRLRNNLFHGAKWDYDLQNQRENFTQANSVLMRLLERHGQLGTVASAAPSS